MTFFNRELLPKEKSTCEKDHSCERKDGNPPRTAIALPWHLIQLPVSLCVLHTTLHNITTQIQQI